MGEALVGGLLATGIPTGQLRVAELDPVRRKQLEENRGVECSDDAAAVVDASDVVVLALKPGVVRPVLEGLAGSSAQDPLWISIAAGVTLASLGAPLPAQARIVRAMPNTPALVGAGATAICGNTSATADDLALARALFESVGSCWTAPNEGLIDAVTGLSGSGPAYVFTMIQALADGGVQAGLTRPMALELAAQTVLGAARMVLETGRHPLQLRDEVASPGGTTIEGIAVLEELGFKGTVMAAVEAAAERSRELSGK